MALRGIADTVQDAALYYDERSGAPVSYNEVLRVFNDPHMSSKEKTDAKKNWVKQLPAQRVLPSLGVAKRVPMPPNKAVASAVADVKRDNKVKDIPNISLPPIVALSLFLKQNDLISDKMRLDRLLTDAANAYGKDDDAPMPDVFAEKYSLVPSYRVTQEAYSSFPPDASLWKILTMVYSDAEVTERIDGFLDVADRIAEEGCLSTGSFTGQLGRLTNYFETANKAKGVFKGDPSDMKSILKRFWFRTNEEHSEKWLAPLTSLTLSEMEERYEEFISPFRVNKTSDAGICFPNCTRGQVLVQEGVLLRILRSVLEGKSFKWETWNWLRLAKLKPKLEYYTYPKLKVRSRNIWSFNTWSFSYAQLFFRALFSANPGFPADPNSRTLIGFNPFGGGVDRLLNGMSKRLLDGSSTFSWAVFSDNLYVLVKTDDGLYWLSLDGSMMEATNTPDFIKFFVNSCIEFVQESLSKKMCQPLVYYLTEVFTKMASESVAVLGSTQTPIHGLGSGALATGYINNANMLCTAALVFADKGVRQVNHSKLNTEVEQKKLVESFGLRGVFLKVERVMKFDSSTGQGHRTIPIDLLGFDTVVVGKELLLENKFFAALDKERLMRAIIYDKASARKVLDVKSYNAYKFVKLRALYMMGGGLYPETATVLKVALLAYRYRFGESAPGDVADLAIEEVLDEAAAGLDELVEAAVHMSKVEAVPRLADIVRFNLTRPEYEDWVERVVAFIAKSDDSQQIAMMSDWFSDKDYAEIKPAFKVDWPRQDLNIDRTFVFSKGNTMVGELPDVAIQLGAFQLGKQDEKVASNPQRDQLRGMFSSFNKFQQLDEFDKVIAYYKAFSIIKYVSLLEEPIKLFDEEQDPQMKAFKMFGAAAGVPLPAFAWVVDSPGHANMLRAFTKNVALARNPKLQTDDETLRAMLHKAAKEYFNAGKEPEEGDSWYSPALWHINAIRQEYEKHIGSELFDKAYSIFNKR